MEQVATITSKRQLTIPVSIFREMGLREGDRVVVAKDKNTIVIHPAKDLVEELAGSVSIPRKFKGLSTEKMIRLAKEKHFQKRQ